MRRKSERAASSKKTKSSPERKTEPVKRTRSRRSKKPSTSSENESASEEIPVSTVQEVEIVAPAPKTPVKVDNPEESQDQVWQVKAPASAADTGEIQKLKICLSRPPTTPEKADRSPRHKRKSRATSSSEAHSADGIEEKRKSRHHKKSHRGSKDEPEKNHDSQNEEITEAPVCDDEQPERSEPVSIDKSTEEDSDCNKKIKNNASQDVELNNKPQETVPDTTVESPRADSVEPIENASEDTTNNSSQMEVDNVDKTNKEEIEEKDTKTQDTEEVVEPTKEKVSKVIESDVPSEVPHSPNDNGKVNNDHDVLEIECTQYETEKDPIKELDTIQKPSRARTLERSQSTKSEHEDTHTSNGPPIVVNRKRKWGSRPKVVTQKSLTISTDVLKDIIPDVKPVDMTDVIEEKKPARRVDVRERIEIKDRYEKPVLPKIVIDNTENVEKKREKIEKENLVVHEPITANRKISIVKSDDVLEAPLSPPRNKQSCVLYITNLVRPFTIAQLKNLLQRTGRIEAEGFWINKIKSKCFVKYETEDQAVETRHALHGVTWPVSNPKTLQVDFSTDEAFEKARDNEDNENTQASTIPGTVEDWLREQDQKREKGELEPKPWERKNVREWDVGKGDKPIEEKPQRNFRDERLGDKRRQRTPERSPEPAKKFKKKEEEAPAKLLDDLFRKTKATPCIYWLPLSAETIAIKEEQRRKHMAEHERRLTELRRTRRH